MGASLAALEQPYLVLNRTEERRDGGIRWQRLAIPLPPEHLQRPRPSHTPKKPQGRGRLLGNPLPVFRARTAGLGGADGVLFPQKLLLDVVIYGLGEVVLRSSDSVPLFEYVELDKT